jgi:hypothetical protein
MGSDAVIQYCQRIGRSWNRFWFRRVDTRLVCLMRILVGLSAICYLMTYIGNIDEWFGLQGILPSETVRILTGAESGDSPVYRWSYWYYIDDPFMLNTLLVAELLVVAAFTAGLMTRATSILSYVAIVAHVHRAPMISGQWEPVLCMLLLYLCIAPCGARWSVDAWRKRSDAEDAPEEPSLSANLALGLMQVHLAGFYLMMGLTKLGGETWWTGEAVWWLIAHSESRLIDLTNLHSTPLLINAWTHAIVFYELSFAVLIWVRDARPLLLLMGLIMWVSLAMLTGLVGFSALMLIANGCFFDPWIHRAE